MTANKTYGFQEAIDSTGVTGVITGNGNIHYLRAALRLPFSDRKASPSQSTCHWEGAVDCEEGLWLEDLRSCASSLQSFKRKVDAAPQMVDSRCIATVTRSLLPIDRCWRSTRNNRKNFATNIPTGLRRPVHKRRYRWNNWMLILAWSRLNSLHYQRLSWSEWSASAATSYRSCISDDRSMDHTLIRG